MKLARHLGAGAAALALTVGAAQAQISDDVVRIGVLTDMAGTYSGLAGPGALEAARMAVEDFGGEVAGAPIEIVNADHQNKADIAANISRQWFESDGVDALSELVTTSVALAVFKIAEQANKIVLVSGAASSPLTGDACIPTGIHYTYNTRALAVGTASAIVKEGGDTWYFLTADYAFGKALQDDVSKVVEAEGGKVLGASRHPFPSSDFSSFVLQAQASGAKVIGLANAGSDTTNAIKAANEFGLVAGGQTIAALLMFISDVHALGLETAQGIQLTTGFYWDANDDSRAWSKRFFDRTGAMPTMVQAGVYSSIAHYLSGIKATGTDDTEKVLAWMRETPINDFFAKNGKLRSDGRMVHDMYLVKVKSPAESKGPWDYYEILRTIPGEEAFGTLEESTCPTK
jgi:branched-chain amino acid transport system substrate-binding protein